MNAEEHFEALINAIETKIRQELRLRCEAYEPDFKTPEVFAVVTALLARQATLAIEMASAPQLWNGHSAPLFLRAMTDVHITVSWILLDAPTRAKQYIDYGLGQAVLILEHMKKRLESTRSAPIATMEQAIAAEEKWINFQKLTFLVQVNVGAWSGKTTRQMAEEAGLIDFYNDPYISFSQCAHSTWYHVGRYNSLPSESPLTGLLWIAQISDSSGDIGSLDLAAKYLDKTFNAFDEKALGRSPSSMIRLWINNEIESRFHSDNPQENSTNEGTNLRCGDSPK